MIQRQIFEYDEVLGYRFIANIKARIQHESGAYLLRTNANGFRCSHDFMTQKQKHMNRILLFGDSFTAGDGVSDHKRYAEILENKVEALEVFNYGLPGSGTDQQYLAYQTFAKNIEHDVLVIAVLVENIQRVASHYRLYKNEQGKTVIFAKPFYELDDHELVLRQSPPSKHPIDEKDLSKSERKFMYTGGRFQKLRSLVTKAGIKHMVQKSIRYQPVPEYNQANNPAWLVMKKILEDWIRNHPKPVILMPIPLYQHVEESSDASAYQDRFQELSESTGCVLHDPLNDLLKYTAQQRRAFRFEHDVHLTPKGHQAMADSVAPVIEKVLFSHRQKG